MKKMRWIAFLGLLLARTLFALPMNVQEASTFVLDHLPNKTVSYVIVDPSQQILYVMQSGIIKNHYPISSSKKGVGNLIGSKKTPCGLHQIIFKAGHRAPIGTVFHKGTPTKEIISDRSLNLGQDDLILTRILALSGLESGFNLNGNVDSLSRGIFIHGTAEEALIGQPASHGCIRLTNQDIITLHHTLPTGTLIYILCPKNNKT